MAASQPSVFVRDGNMIIPTALARGPWSPDAQHGGAPAGLLAGLAQIAAGDPAAGAPVAGDPEWLLSRLTLELVRPVPIVPLTVDMTMGRGNTVRRVALELKAGSVTVARAKALLLRSCEVSVPVEPGILPFPGPEACSERFSVPGMAEQTSFHYTAMETRVARGSTQTPGPAAVWFRLTVPLLNDTPTTPAQRAMAAADFGNGISWTLPFDKFLFANTDLTVYLHRAPLGEWVALDSETVVEPSGVGLVLTTLYDEQGRIGVAQQNLLIRSRG